MNITCPSCSVSYERTKKQVNQAIKRRGAWRCYKCSAGHNSLNLLGMKFNELTVIAKAENKTQKTRWLCKCSCGTEKVFYGNCLKRNLVKSCGCIKKEKLPKLQKEGKTRVREYRIWQSMLSRCSNDKTINYMNYGGRGIKVCESWKFFKNFITDMGPCPDGMSIDRINVNGNYEPSNCRWASRIQQARNTRRNRVIEFNGQRKCLVEWANDLGIDQASLRERLDKWPLEMALTKEKRIR